MSTVQDACVQLAHDNDNDNIPSKTPKLKRYMALDAYPSSEEAKRRTGRLAREISAVMEVGHLRKLNDAVGAILAGFMACDHDGNGQWSYRPVGASYFTGLPIGFRPFTTASQGLQRLKYMEARLGFYKRVGGEASSFRATPPLLALAAAYGVSPAHWSEHFASRPRPKLIAKTIVLRAGKRLEFGEQRGRSMGFDWKHSKVIAAKRQVDEINAFFASVTIEGGVHHGFNRVFGAGDDAAFDWNMGGRLYSLGELSYQGMTQLGRGAIMLNGEPVVELDIKASHPTILCAQLGAEQRRPDFYAVEGVARSVVKSWVTMCLGYGKFHTRWSREAADQYAEDFGGASLEADYPFAPTSEKLKMALPEIGKSVSAGAWMGKASIYRKLRRHRRCA